MLNCIFEMMKAIAPVPDCGSGVARSKCAEIHYHTEKFSILCIFCGMRTPKYTSFVEHFQEEHCQNLPTVTQGVMEAPATKRPHRDPLDVADKPCVEDCAKDKRMSEDTQLEIKVEAVDMSEFNAIDIQTVCSESVECVERTLGGESNGSDDGSTLCKVKLEEFELSETSMATASEMSANTRQHKGTGVKKKEASCSADCSRSAADESKLCFRDILSEDDSASEQEQTTAGTYGHEDATEYLSSDNEGVDWTQPYNPNSLKNHHKRPYKPRNKPNACTYCGRTFRRRYQLDTHMNIHTGLKPHQCEICGRQFRAVTTLQRHRITHEQRNAHKCKYCEKLFTHRAALVSHEMRHTQERTVPCDECEKLFYTHNQMDTHKRKVHPKADMQDDPALPFACNLCQNSYRSASMLSTHRLKKHYKTAKYTCEKCEKKFVYEEQLQQHQKIHTYGATKF